MKIFYDPTEAREGTKLPVNVLQAGVALPGLEGLTGGDILISPLSTPELTRVSSARPHQLALRKHTESGLIIQRKSGNDFIGSVTKLDEIQQKMCEWGNGWLLVTGEFGCKRIGEEYKAIIDGRVSGFNYWAVIGALDYWQMRGCGLTFLPSDGHIGKWLSDMARRVSDTYENKLKVLEPRKARQAFEMIGQDEEEVKIRLAVQVLMAFPGIGYKTARNIAETYGNLARSLCEISSPLVLKSDSKPDGVGKELVSTVRHVLGFGDEVKGELIPDDCFYQLRPLLTPNDKWLKHRQNEFKENVKLHIPELTEDALKMVVEMFMSYYVTFLSIGC